MTRKLKTQTGFFNSEINNATQFLTPRHVIFRVVISSHNTNYGDQPICGGNFS